MLTSADIQFIVDNEKGDVSRLLLGKAPQGVNLQLCCKCIQAREKMKVKAPLWYANPSLVYPFSVSVEQGSSQTTALFKQKIIAGLFAASAPVVESVQAVENFLVEETTPVADSTPRGKEAIFEDGIVAESLPRGLVTADLTGGMGIDSFFISQIADTHYYFERNGELCRATEYNLGQLGAGNIKFANRDVTADDCAALRELEGKGVDILYIDPARRTQQGGKAILLQDYEPNVIELQERMFAVSRHILVKVSPMADIKLNLRYLPKTKAVYVLSVDNECKELLFLLDREHNGQEPLISCVDCNSRNGEMKTFSLTIKEEEECVANYSNTIGKYIYEPNKAVMKGGGYKLVSTRFNCGKLAPSTHLYTSNEMTNDFPGKIFSVEEVIPFNKKTLKDVARRFPKADITARNFPMDTNSLKKLSGIKDGGEKHIFAVTLSNGDKILIITAHIVYL